MSNSKSFTESTSADSTILGFDYQFFFFIYKLLELKVDEVIGLEVKDDVHVINKDGSTILYQLKHSIQTNADGSIKNLTELDSDLWKTLSNWCNVITDKNDGREKTEQQIKFINQHDFILITNKSHSSSNNFFKKYGQYNDKIISLNDFIDYLINLNSSTSDIKVAKYIENLINLNRDCLEFFLSKITIVLYFDDLIVKIKNCLKTKMIAEEKLYDVLTHLIGNIKLDNYIELKFGNKYEISFNDFHTKYKSIFINSRNKFNKVPFNPEIPEKLFEQRFIHRLLEIEAIEENDIAEATILTSHKLRLENSLMHWMQIGDVIQEEIEDFHNDNLQFCINKFKFVFKKCKTEDEIIDVALQHYSELTTYKFKIIDTELDYKLSNGELYSLSDKKLIGWHKDWKSK